MAFDSLTDITCMTSRIELTAKWGYHRFAVCQCIFIIRSGREQPLKQCNSAIKDDTAFTSSVGASGHLRLIEQFTGTDERR